MDMDKRGDGGVMYIDFCCGYSPCFIYDLISIVLTRKGASFPFVFLTLLMNGNTY
jgi:hypothetical protein